MAIPLFATRLKNDIIDALSSLSSTLYEGVTTAAAAEKVYTSIALGLADTVDGESFYVAVGGEITLYRNDNGVAAPLADLATGADITGLAEKVAVYQKAAELKSYAINGLPASDGSFVQTLDESMNAAYAPPFPERQAATDLAECVFIPPTNESTLSVATDAPYATINGAKYRVFPVDIRTNLFNTPASIPLFKPQWYNGSGFLTFEYIGKEPLHVTLKGNMSMLVRTGGLESDAWSETLLRLNQINPPTQEEGEGAGRRNLSSYLGSFGAPEQITAYSSINDLCQPPTPGFISLSNSYPKIPATSVNGYFNFGDTTEELRTEDVGVPVGPNVRTTDWMDISSYDKTKTAFYLHGTGRTTRRRVQVKNAAGVISSGRAMTLDRTGAWQIYRFSPGDEQVRIYYSGPEDNASIEGLRVISQVVSAEYDPVKGFWIERTFNINRDVSFYPGVVYFFDLFTSVFDGATAREWGFRLQSGGMNFLFDAGPFKNDLALRAYTGGI